MSFILAILGSRIGRMALAGLGIAALLGGIYWYGAHKEAERYEALRAKELAEAIAAEQTAQLANAKRAQAELEAEAEAARKRIARLTEAQRRIDSAQGACLDEAIPDDVRRALNGVPADGVRD